MKNIFGWLRWSWGRFELWQKIFIFAMFLQLSSLLMPEPFDRWSQGIGLCIIMMFVLKWVIVDPIRSSYQNYQKHRNELLTTIKNSDQ